MAEAKKKSTAEWVWEMAAPVAGELGLRLWDVQFVKEGAEWFLRIFIDKDQGISIDDCVNMTHAVNPILDKEDPISREYTLEVSSPGLNRRLTRKEHFLELLGAPVKVKLIRPMENGARELEGILTQVHENGDFEVLIDAETSATFTRKECSSVILMDDDF